MSETRTMTIDTAKWLGKDKEASTSHRTTGNEGMLRAGEILFPREEYTS